MFLRLCKANYHDRARSGDANSTLVCYVILFGSVPFCSSIFDFMFLFCMLSRVFAMICLYTAEEKTKMNNYINKLPGHLRALNFNVGVSNFKLGALSFKFGA